MSDMNTLLDTADRIVAADLHPARLRGVIGDLASALRETTALLKESREYGLAIVKELSARDRKHDHFAAMAASMDDDFQALQTAVKALGAMPEGYCFCSKNRIGDASKTHEPECADIRVLLRGN